MVAAVTGGKALPEEVLGRILADTNGVPLFVEEMTKTVLESGLLVDAGDRYTLSGGPSTLSIPASLQDTLTARLDRLEAEKAVRRRSARLSASDCWPLCLPWGMTSCTKPCPSSSRRVCSTVTARRPM